MSGAHFLLGLPRDPASGHYDLRAEFTDRRRHSRSAEFSQIHPTLRRLGGRSLPGSRLQPASCGPNGGSTRPPHWAARSPRTGFAAIPPYTG